ncbi:MAG: hypothetical protein Ct9H90mP16_10000 [Candidatus Poseidoniales archaeon]|nr:MAG: hypothetical protein Ct9H90mP16_10000 [Candidatus Poseidoniales archaeon]
MSSLQPIRGLRIGTHIVLRVKESHRFTILAYLCLRHFSIV